VTSAQTDPDGWAVSDPRTPPRRLADIAARRWDLHPQIAAHPQAYPALRGWIASVNPGSARPTTPYAGQQLPYPAQQLPPYARARGAGSAAQQYPYAAPPPRQGRSAGWLAGCGCLVLVALVAIVAVVIGLLGAGGAGDGGDEPDSPTSTQGSGDDASADELFAQAETAMGEYHELASLLDGNPVAALVTRPARAERLDAALAEPPMNVYHAQDVLERATQYRDELRALVNEAAGRRTDSSDSEAARLVDAAGKGFIALRADADTECATSDEAGTTTAGCTSSDELAVHVLPGSKRIGGKAGLKYVVLHELAHLYQYADGEAAGPDGDSESFTLKQQGLFQGSGESMADCYALTYLDRRSLTFGDAVMGYDYVCNDQERAAIRTWAAHMNAPMPG